MKPSVQHLHPLSVLFGTLSTLPGTLALIGGLFVLNFLREGDFRLTMTMIIFIAIAVMTAMATFLFHLVQYFILTIRYEGDEIIINRGLFMRSERHIPYRRIQNIDVIQNLLHRLFKVGIVKIETSSGGEPEAVLRVLSLDAIETMRQRVFGDAAGSAPPAATAGTPVPPVGDAHPVPSAATAEAEEQLIALNLRDLAQVGLITNRGLTIVGVAVGAAWQLNWQFDLWERYDVTATAMEWVEQLRAPILFWIAAGIVALLLLYLFSIGWSIVRFHGFRLVRRGEDLRISCGLFTRVGATVPRRRIQFITVRESLLHRLFGKAAIRIETAGANISDDETTLLSRRWFIPLLPRDQVEQMIERVQDEFSLRDLNWQPLAPKARRRMIRRSILFMSLLGLLLTLLVWPWGIAGLLVLPVLGAIHAWRHAAVIRWAMTNRPPGAIAYRSGVIFRRTSITLFNRVHTAAVDETPFDRRWSMATLGVDTAGAGTAGHRIRIRFLPAQLANDLRSTIAAKAEAAGFHWA